MPILTGFPQSNTVMVGTKIPFVRETKIKNTKLEPEHRFRHAGAEFMVLRNGPNDRGFKAICYKGSKKAACIAGHIYGFAETEVIWLEEYF